MSSRQDEVFKAMADPHRRRILSELCRQSREAGELARMVGLAPNAASFHLRALKAADLVSVRRDGRFLRYSLEPSGLRSWRGQVDRLFPADLLKHAPLPEVEDEDASTYAHDESSGADLETDTISSQHSLPTELL